MSFGYNPLTGQFDLLGTGGGGPSPSGPAERHVGTFNNTTDWTLNTGLYELTVTAATHGKGVTPNVLVYETVGLTFELVNTVVILNASGDVTIQVTSTPDNRFNGKWDAAPLETTKS